MQARSPASDRFRRLPAPVRGALWMMVSAACFSVMSAAVRHLSAELSPFEITFLRNLFGLVIVLPFVLRTGQPLFRTRHWPLYVARAAIGLVAMWAWYYAVSITPLAEAVALNFTVPLFTIPAAILILREKVGIRRWGATLVGFLGVLIILQPGSVALSLGGLLAITAAAFFAFSLILVKILTRTESPAAIVFYMNLIMTPMVLGPAILVWETPSWVQLGWLAIIGAVGTLGHISLVRAFAATEATVVVPFDFMRLPFAALIAYFAFGEVPQVWTWIGAAVIIAGTVYITHRESRLKRAPPPADLLS